MPRVIPNSPSVVIMRASAALVVPKREEARRSYQTRNLSEADGMGGSCEGSPDPCCELNARQQALFRHRFSK